MDEFVVFEALKKDEIKHIVRLQVRIGTASASGLRRSSIHVSAGNALAVSQGICTAQPV